MIEGVENILMDHLRIVCQILQSTLWGKRYIVPFKQWQPMEAWLCDEQIRQVLGKFVVTFHAIHSIWIFFFQLDRKSVV